MYIHDSNSRNLKNQGAVFGLHPLVAAAAVSIIALSGVGITTMLMNRSGATTTPPTVAATEAPAPQAVAPESTPPVPTSPAELEKPVGAQPAHVASKTVRKPSKPAQVAALNTPAAPVYNPPVSSPPVAQIPAPCHECAVVESTRELKVAGQGSGLGAIAGGVIGGLLGNRVGAGNGRAVATVAGAVGGGFAGNAIEKSTKAGIEYELTVRFEDGTTQIFKRSSPWPYGKGDSVRVIDNQIVSRG